MEGEGRQGSGEGEEKTRGGFFLTNISSNIEYTFKFKSFDHSFYSFKLISLSSPTTYTNFSTHQCSLSLKKCSPVISPAKNGRNPFNKNLSPFNSTMNGAPTTSNSVDLLFLMSHLKDKLHSLLFQKIQNAGKVKQNTSTPLFVMERL